MENRKSHPMPRHLADDPDHWRQRGEEIRVLGEAMEDAKSRAIMLRIADDYEKLADRAQQRLQSRGYVELSSTVDPAPQRNRA